MIAYSEDRELLRKVWGLIYSAQAREQALWEAGGSRETLVAKSKWERERAYFASHALPTLAALNSDPLEEVLKSPVRDILKIWIHADFLARSPNLDKFLSSEGLASVQTSRAVASAEERRMKAAFLEQTGGGASGAAPGGQFAIGS